MPTGAGVVSISPGFVHDVYSANVIDAPQSFGAAGFVLAGNHFGTIVKNNRVVGVGEAFSIIAMASETPGIWGWSHVPVFGMTFDGNTIEDSPRGAVFTVFHNEYGKSNKGRVYMTVALKGNTVRWSDAFLQSQSRPGAKATAAGITLGQKGSIDPGELIADARDDRLTATVQRGSPPALKVHSAVLNGKSVSSQTFPLPAGHGGADGAGPSLPADRPRR